MRNVATTYAARLANILALFILFPVIAREFPPSEYGVYLMTASMASMFATDLGMAGSATRYVSEARAKGDESRLRSVMASSAGFFFAIGLVCSLALALTLLIGWNGFEFSPSQEAIALATGTSALSQVVLGAVSANDRAILTGVGRIDLANAILFAQALVRFFGTLFALWAFDSIVWVAVIDAVSAGVGAVAFTLVRKRVMTTRLSLFRDFSWPVLHEMLALTRDLLVMSLAATVILYSGGLIVALTTSPIAVAMFAAGQRIYQVAKEVPNSLTAPLLPVATTNHVSQDGRNSALYVEGTKFAFTLVLAFFPPVMLYMGTLVEWWLGPSYAMAADVAVILVASVALNCMHLVAVPVLGGQGDLRAYAALHGVWAILAVTLGWWLSIDLGAVGMALGMTLPLIFLEPMYVRVALARVTAGWSQFIVRSLMRPLMTTVPAVVATSLWWGLSPLSGVTDALLGCALWGICFVSAAWLGVLSTEQRAHLRPGRRRTYLQGEMA